MVALGLFGCIISIHALRVEGDEADLLGHLLGDISIHALRVEGDVSSAAFTGEKRISIHALRVEGDRDEKEWDFWMNISIHALRVEGDAWEFYNHPDVADFYPRPPGGGRRANMVDTEKTRGYFYPRPPGGGRHMHQAILLAAVDFYPRPPGGGRHRVVKSPPLSARFLSTPSGWRATIPRIADLCPQKISIHALRVEGDPPKPLRKRQRRKFLSTPSGWRATRAACYPCGHQRYFYPRPPGGGRRHVTSSVRLHRTIFLSTPSGWRATSVL